MLIGYARVSRDDQDLSLQRDALTAAGCEKLYEDKMSGAKSARPGLERALETLRRGDTFVVWRLDRASRSVRDLIDLSQKLNKSGVVLRSLKEQIDTSTSAGELYFHIMGALAQFERSLIQERTSAGLAAARARGRKGGRPRALTDAQISAARAMLADPAITVDDVANHLGASRATIYRVLPAGGRATLFTRTASESGDAR